MRHKALLVWLIAFVLAACARARPVYWVTDVDCKARNTCALAPSNDGFLAGATTVDITPPLHLAMWGHGPEGRVATGFRLRLQCMPFVISQGDEVVALVPCDLPAPSLGLQRAIASRLAHLGVPIPATRIFIMATHTHAGPAHYFDTRRYSGSFSSMAPGHDPKVLEFLADRISSAIVKSFHLREPACLGWRNREVDGLSFNRAYVPFLANERQPEIVAKLFSEVHDREVKGRDVPLRGQPPIEQTSPKEQVEAPSPTSPSPPGLAETGAERAVDRGLRVLRIDRRARGGECTKDEGQRPLGVFAVFGLHPTGAPNTNDLYNGDIFGFATRFAAQCLSSISLHGDKSSYTAADCSPPIDGGDPSVIVGLANGIEGDVVPRIYEQSMAEARRIGRALGWSIVENTLGSFTMSSGMDATKGESGLRALYQELEMPSGALELPEHPNDVLCEEAAVGAQAGGGAMNGPTRVRLIPELNAGYRPTKDDGSCHRYKLPLRLGAPAKSDFPTIGAISLVRVAGGVVASVPAEVTTVVGLRIRDAIARGLEQTPIEDATHPIAIVGLTNSYLQYVTTREEYDFQFYEGASCLYGPRSAEFFVRHFECLAIHASRGKSPCTRSRAIDSLGSVLSNPAPLVERFIEDQGSYKPLALTTPAPVCSIRGTVRGYEAKIEKLPLSFTSDRGNFKVEVVRCDRIEDGRCTGPTVADDRGSSIEVRELEDGDHWRLRWIPELTADLCGDPQKPATFSIKVDGLVKTETKVFTLDCNKDCGAKK